MSSAASPPCGPPRRGAGAVDRARENRSARPRLSRRITRLHYSPLIDGNGIEGVPTRLDVAVLRWLTVCLVSVVLLQRIAVPLGGAGFVPLILPLTLALIVVGCAARLLTIDPSRLVLIFAALVLCGAIATVHLLRDPDASLFSFGYLVLLYAPFAAVVRRPQRWVVDRLFDRFEVLMLVAALVALAQMGSQLVGIRYSDILGDVLPQHFLVPGYNTSYPLTYGASIYKSNGYLFLEPSFLSQFLGTAVVVRLARGKVGWRLFIYLAAIATTVAGTGIVLALVGALIVLCTRHARVVAIVFGPLVAIGAAVAATPLGGIFAARALEVGNSDSSASLRFVQPFQVLGGAWAANVRTMLLGNGPGASERYVVRLTGSTTLQQPVPLKLVFDYGGIAAVVFLVAVAVCVLWRPPLRPLAGGLLLAYLMLSSALLQPITVLTVWLLTSALSHAPDPATADATAPGASHTRGRGRPAPPPTNEAELMRT